MSHPFRRKPKGKRAAPPPPSLQQDPLALSRGAGVTDNIAVQADGTYAWFRLGHVRWSFLTPGERTALIAAQQIRLADLAPRRIHLRRTSHPFAAWLWAEELDRATQHPLIPPPGAPTWNTYLDGAQRRMQQLGASSSSCYWGVRITSKRLTAEQLERVTRPGHHDSDETCTKFSEELDKVTRIMRGEGFRATAVSARSLALLVQSSVGLGTPVAPELLAGEADEWSGADFQGFTQSVYASADALDPTVEVRTLRKGKEYVAHVGVLSLERMEGRPRTPSGGLLPWLSAGDDLPFDVEWSCRFDVLPGEALKKSAEVTQTRAESLHQHHEEHNHRPPLATKRAIASAERITDEVTTGSKENAARVIGTFHCAVTGPDRATVLDRIADLTSMYAKDQRATLSHTYSQYALYRQFIPGEPRTILGFDKQIPVYFLARAVPNAWTVLGDKRGPYLGMSKHSAVNFDPCYGPMHPVLNASGMSVLCAGLGGGKSALAGVIVEAAVRSGRQALVNDPSGALGRALANMPALKPFTSIVELSSAEAGTLVPHNMVWEPRREDFTDHQEYGEAIREAEGERMDLLTDALTGFLPATMLEERGVHKAIETAVAAAGGKFGLNPWVVVKALLRGGEIERGVGEYLENVSTMKGVALVFPEDRDSHYVESKDYISDSLLTVFTMRGITPGDPHVDRKHWSRAQRMAAPILHLSSNYAMRFMQSSQKPKVIVNDEVGILGEDASAYSAMLVRGNRDSRKFNTFFGQLTQNPDDMLRLTSQISNLIGTAFIGRMKDYDSAAAGLALAMVPTGIGYEKTLLNVEPGSFLMRDYDGNVEVVDVDLGWRPDLAEALNTTPPTEPVADDGGDWMRALDREMGA